MRRWFTLLLVLCFGVIPALLQGDDPPLPPLSAAALRLPLLLPDQAYSGTLSTAYPQHAYIVLVRTNDALSLTMSRASGNLVPFVRLRALDGTVLVEQAAQDLAGRRIELHYVPPRQTDQWIVVEVASDPASSTAGNYTLTLSGTTQQFAALIATVGLSTTPDVLGDLITLTPTMTSTHTFTPTFTRTPTRTPTSTPTATATVTLTICSGVLPSRLRPGDHGRVTPGNPNNIRRRPGLDGERITQIPGGGEFDVISGPVCADNYAWYEVDYQGTVGWTAESGQGSYWLELINP